MMKQLFWAEDGTVMMEVRSVDVITVILDNVAEATADHAEYEAISLPMPSPYDGRSREVGYQLRVVE